MGLLAGTPSGVPASLARPPGVPLLVLLNLSRASLSRNFQNPFVCKIYILSRSVALVLSGPPATMSHSNHPNLPKHEDRPHQPKPPKLAEAPELPKPGKHAELPEPAEPMEAPEPTETLEPPGPQSRPLGELTLPFPLRSRCEELRPGRLQGDPCPRLNLWAIKSGSGESPAATHPVWPHEQRTSPFWDVLHVSYTRNETHSSSTSWNWVISETCCCGLHCGSIQRTQTIESQFRRSQADKPSKANIQTLLDSHACGPTLFKRVAPARLTYKRCLIAIRADTHFSKGSLQQG